MGKKSTPKQVQEQSQEKYQQVQAPGPTETQVAAMTPGFTNNYNAATEQAKADYGNIMGQYQNFQQGLKPTKFTYNPVTASAAQPKELGESYGIMREALPGYRDFANTGGYSAQDITDLRSRGVAPIRSVYGNSMMELDRARALGGNAGSPNYIAALSRAQRELPQQISDATQNVNAGLAQDIRQGKLAGLSGLSGIGSSMGSLASAQGGRELEAQLANQSADLRAQGMSEDSIQNMNRNTLSAISGRGSMYSATPGQASLFGNQAMNALGMQGNLENARFGQGNTALNTQLAGFEAKPGQTPWWQTAINVAGTAAPYVAAAMGKNNSGQDPNFMGPQQPSSRGSIPAVAPQQSSGGGGSWWKTALGVAGTVAPYLAFFSSRKFKHDIRPLRQSTFAKKLRELQLYEWKYKGDNITHIGPTAEGFKRAFGVGDGTTINLADVAGVLLAAEKGKHA